MVDVLLIQPPVEDFYFTAKRSIPYGLACVAAALAQSGFSVRILDGLASAKSRRRTVPECMAYLEPYYGRQDRSPFALFHAYRHFGYSIGHLQKQIIAARPDVIGISSLFSAYGEQALQMARAAKECFPDVAVVLGGHHPTARPEQVLACPSVDFVLRGEGEVSMPPLVKALKDGREVDTVPGVAYRLPGGGVHVTAPAIVRQLERMPLPADELIDLHFYKRARGAAKVVVASRGCPMHCSYCALARSAAVPYRRRSVDAVMREIDIAVHRHGARFIDFEDENISLERAWFLELLTRIAADYSGLGLELRAMNGLFPPSLDDTVICAMQAAGFKTLNLSLGTLSIPQLKRFHRPDIHHGFENALASAKRLGLSVVGYIIGGAPFQAPLDTLNDLLHLSEAGVLAALSVYYPSPGSRDFRTLQTRGLLPPQPDLWRSSALPVEHTTSRTELITLMRLARLLNFVKAMGEKGVNVPRPEPYEGQAIPPGISRDEVGLRLLAWFMFDGVIRGVDHDGLVYEHSQALTLARAAVNRIGTALRRQRYWS